jgi:hypothetical protein
MDWVDKLNRWALKGMRQHTVEKVETTSEGCRLIYRNGSRFIAWSEMQEIAVLKQPPLAIGCFAVAIRGADSTVAIVDDTVAGYPEFCAELPRRLEGVVPYEKWAVELTAAPQEVGQVIFRRSERRGIT